MTTTTVIGVTGSFHTITFHGFFVSTASSVFTSPSVVVRRRGCVEAMPPVFQTDASIERVERSLSMRTRGRKVSDPLASEALTQLRRRVNRDIRRAVGLSKEPPPRCNDPEERSEEHTSELQSLRH